MPKISAKTSTLGLWGALLLLLVICAVSVLNLRASDESARAGRRATETIFLLEDILDHLQDMETGQRGFLFTSKEEYLQPYNDALKTLDPLLDQLRLKFAGSEVTEQDLLRKMEQSITWKRKELAQTVADWKQGKREKVLWDVRGGSGKGYMDDIRKTQGILRDLMIQERGEAVENATQTRQVSFAVVIGGSALLFLIVAGSTSLIQRSIARQEQISEARRISEENLSVTLSSVGDGLIATDRDNIITMINGVTAKLTGWSEAEAQGKPIDEVFRIVNESSRAKVINPAEEAIRENRIVELANHTVLIAKNGTEIFIDDSAAPIRDKEGNVRGAILVFRDVTHRKQIQKAQEALNIRLRRAMAETHHRVKNNLQVIAALVEVQLGDGEATVPVEAMQRVKQHVVALATIHDILTQEAKEKGDADTLQTYDILGKLRPLLQDLVGEATLSFDIDNVSLPIRQGTSLAVLVNELVSNAVKHGDGLIEITLKELEGQQARLAVRDHGTGFPANFNPRKAANTGLELIDSLGRWDLHGTITYANHPEGGAVIAVTFPLDTPPPTADER